MTPMHAGQAVIDCDIHTAHSQRRGAVPVSVGPLARVHPHVRVQGRRSTRPIRRDAPTTAAPGAASRTAGQLGRRSSRTCSIRGTVEVGILNCAYAVDSLHNPDTAAAMAARSTTG